MNSYIIMIENRNYDKWTIHNMETMEEADNDVTHPLTNKLFSMDVFSFISPVGETVPQSQLCNSIRIERSPVRTNTNISGVLILKNNKTYGRHHRNHKLLYKCIPDDKRIPIFLVPYEIKTYGFNKNLSNIYVTIEFDLWDDKHPMGKLTNVIGEVDELNSYYEYQLYCKSLNSSIQKFTSDTKKSIKYKQTGQEEEMMQDIGDTYDCKGKGIQDRTDWPIYTIDPIDSTDFDDAVGHTYYLSEERGIMVSKLSIYISNVSLLLDSLNLWSSFSKRISTIYLPDRKRPMLPTVLSDGLCSLVENKTRFAYVMDIHILEGEIIDIEYLNAKIRVNKNYRYEEDELLELDEYNVILNIAKSLIPTYKYISSIRNSHDLVAYLMILMNYESAKEMLKFNNGIFRNVIAERIPDTPIPQTLSHDVLMFFKMWNSGAAQYINIERLPPGTIIRHDTLEVDAYLHITSPIRRLVDLLNMIKLQHNLSITELSSEAEKFYTEWTKKIEYINTTMQAIRKVQNDCALISLVHSNKELINSIYDGYVFDRIDRSGIWQYNVYIPVLKWMSKITTCTKLNNYDTARFRLHLFKDEDSVKRKLRLSVFTE